MTDSSPSATVAEKENAKDLFKKAKAAHQNVVRKYNTFKEVKRDEELHALLSKDPKDIFKSFRNAKSTESGKLKYLQVGEKLFPEDHVADGFFESISNLKTLPEISSPSFERF